MAPLQNRGGGDSQVSQRNGLTHRRRSTGQLLAPPTQTPIGCRTSEGSQTPGNQRAMSKRSTGSCDSMSWARHAFARIDSGLNLRARDDTGLRTVPLRRHERRTLTEPTKKTTVDEDISMYAETLPSDSSALSFTCVSFLSDAGDQSEDSMTMVESSAVSEQESERSYERSDSKPQVRFTLTSAVDADACPPVDIDDDLDDLKADDFVDAALEKSEWLLRNMSEMDLEESPQHLRGDSDFSGLSLDMTPEGLDEPQSVGLGLVFDELHPVGLRSASGHIACGQDVPFDLAKDLLRRWCSISELVKDLDAPTEGPSTPRSGGAAATVAVPRELVDQLRHIFNLEHGADR